MIKFEFQAIGTTWVIDIKEKISPKDLESLQNEIMERVALFDLVYSRFRQDSIVTKMSEKSGKYVLPDDADLMFSLYRKMYDVTSGLVTPLIGQVLVDAGYDAKYSLVEKTTTKPKTWDEVLIWQKPELELLSPALLDFGAGGKGYLVDIVSEVLERNNIFSYCVDAGGDMRYRSTEGKPLRVGLEHPGNTSEVIGVVNILNQSICGSAGNRRKWGNYHHIINPETLSSPKEIEAVWVITDTTILSDLLTTALFFVDARVLLKHFDFEYLVVYSDYSIYKSERFEAEIFS